MAEEKYSTTHSIPQPYMEVSSQLQTLAIWRSGKGPPGTQNGGTHSQSECYGVQGKLLSLPETSHPAPSLVTTTTHPGSQYKLQRREIQKLDTDVMYTEYTWQCVSWSLHGDCNKFLKFSYFLSKQLGWSSEGYIVCYLRRKMEEVETRQHSAVSHGSERRHHRTVLRFNLNSWSISPFANRENQQQKLL